MRVRRLAGDGRRGSRLGLEGWLEYILDRDVDQIGTSRERMKGRQRVRIELMLCILGILMILLLLFFLLFLLLFQLFCLCFLLDSSCIHLMGLFLLFLSYLYLLTILIFNLRLTLLNTYLQLDSRSFIHYLKSYLSILHLYY